MVKLTVVVQVQKFHEGGDLVICDLHLVGLAVLILSREVIGEVDKLLKADVAEGEDLLLDIVDIIDETLESDEFLERDFPLYLHLIYAFQIPSDLIWRQAH